MKTVVWCLFLLALALLPSRASSGDIAMPAPACDVFDFAFCFARPHDGIVELRSGPDFGVHRVLSRDAQWMFSIYSGMAPERKAEDVVALAKYRKEGVAIEVGSTHDAEGRHAIDVRLRYPSGFQLHVFGARDAAGRAALADVMTSFRRCSKRGDSGIECKSQPLFDARVADLVRKVE